jgi:PhnB protein
MPGPADYKDKIMHAQLESDGLTLMASEGRPDQPVKAGDNISISLSGPAKGKLTEIFNQLAAGGQVTMPLATQSWGDTFGMLTDQFGIHWMVDITKE